MHHSRKAHRGILLALLACACGWPARPALAQPDLNAPGQLLAISTAWKALRQQTEGLETENPQEAINTYKAFFDQQGYRSGEVAIDLSSRIAQLYWRELNDRAKAGEIYDWAIRQYGGLPGGERLVRERALLTGDKVVAVPTVKAAPGAGGAGVAPVGSGASGGHGPGVDSVQGRPGAGATLPAPPPILLPLPSALMPIGAAPTATVASVSTAKVAQTLVLAQLRAGGVEPGEAWARGDLTADTVLEWITEHRLRWPEDATLANALLDQVAKHAPERLTSTALKAQPVETRVRIGDYFSSQHDERAVALYQDVMDASGAAPGVTPAWFGPAGARLGAFYADNGQPQKAVQEYLRVAKALPPGDRYAANVVIDAARLYTQMGDTARAQELYAQVASYGNGWVTGIALFDQANKLLKQGKYEEARKLLQQPVAGTRSEQVQVILLALLGISYYETGEFEAARKYSQAAVSKYKSLDTPEAGEGVEAHFNMAEETLERIERWSKAPIICEPTALFIVVRARERHIPIMSRIIVRTFRDTPLAVTADSPKVNARLVANGPVKEHAVDVAKQVIIEIAPQSLKESFDAMVSVRSPSYPNFEARMPVSVDVRDDE